MYPMSGERASSIARSGAGPVPPKSPRLTVFGACSRLTRTTLAFRPCMGSFRAGALASVGAGARPPWRQTWHARPSLPDNRFLPFDPPLRGFVRRRHFAWVRSARGDWLCSAPRGCSQPVTRHLAPDNRFFPDNPSPRGFVRRRRAWVRSAPGWIAGGEPVGGHRRHPRDRFDPFHPDNRGFVRRRPHWVVGAGGVPGASVGSGRRRCLGWVRSARDGSTVGCRQDRNHADIRRNRYDRGFVRRRRARWVRSAPARPCRGGSVLGCHWLCQCRSPGRALAQPVAPGEPPMRDVKEPERA